MLFKLIGEAIKSIRDNFDTLGNALTIPFLLYIAIYFSGEFIDSSYLVIFVAILHYGLDTLIAVTTHRIVLLGPGSVPRWGLYKWTMRETYFVLHVIGLWLIIALGWVLLMAVTYVLGNVSGFLIIFGLIAAVVVFPSLWGRLSLVFPSIAIDEKISFKKSWELSEGYEILMALVIIILPLFLMIPVLLVKFLAFTPTLESLEDLNYKVSMISTLLTPLYIVISIAILSVTYKYIKEEKLKAQVDTPVLENPDDPGIKEDDV